MEEAHRVARQGWRTWIPVLGTLAGIAVGVAEGWLLSAALIG